MGLGFVSFPLLSSNPQETMTMNMVTAVLGRPPTEGGTNEKKGETVSAQEFRKKKSLNSNDHKNLQSMLSLGGVQTKRGRNSFCLFYRCVGKRIGCVLSNPSILLVVHPQMTQIFKLRIFHSSIQKRYVSEDVRRVRKKPYAQVW